MATKEAELDSEQLRLDFLECPLCFEKFIKPKALPCQHSFCLKCLQNYVTARGQASTIPCPLCKQITEIPGNDVSKFPNNFTLENLSDFVKASMQIPYDVTSRRQQCDACGDIRCLETFCSTCELWLCQVCTRSHKNIPSSRSHCLTTNMEVNIKCIETASEKAKEVKRLQQDIKQKLTRLTEIKHKDHSDVDDVKEQIKSTAEEAHQVINAKENILLEELSYFEVMWKQTAKYESYREIDVTIDNILQVINEVTMSSSGRENQGRIGIVKEFLTNSETNPCLPVSIEESVCFASSNFLGDLRNMDMGYIHGINRKMNTRMLIERPVRLREIILQGMGGPVYSLAYSAFTNRLLAVVGCSITVINPDGGERKSFLSSSSKRKMVDPQRVACSEDGCRLFVIEAERGKRVITSYTHDGMFNSIIKSKLSRHIDLAVYGSFIFVCDEKDECVYVLNMSGEIVKVLKETSDHKDLFTCPRYISVGGNGRFAVSDDFHLVHIFDKDYTLLYTYLPDIAHQHLTGVQVLPDGSVLVCDGNNGLHYISPDFSKTGLLNFENISSLSSRSITINEKSHTIYIGSREGKIYSMKYYM